MGELREAKDGRPEECCGNIAGFDRKGEPIWVNGAFRGDTIYKVVTHYAHDGDNWDFGPRCVGNNLTAMNEKQLKIVSDVKKTFSS